MLNLKGLIAAPFTPFTDDGEIMYEQISAYSEFLVRNQISGVFINGSTGETASLTQKEKMKLTESWTSAIKGTPMKVITLVGGTSYHECVENAMHGESYGVDAIAIVAPYYFKPAGPQQLAEFCAKIADKVPDLPVYLYHIPVLSGVNIPMYDFLKVAAPMIPNLAGVKYTHENFMDFLSCVNFEGGKYQMLGGYDEVLLPALSVGCRSAVGSTFNYAAPLYRGIIDAFDSGDLDMARQLQLKAIDMIRLLGKYGGIATGKAFMRYTGFEFGGFRLPVKSFDPSMYPQFKADVQALHMEEWFSK
ncbi:MAG: dihydrodipicolinate synthase family protein [Bacteroidota bacterium]